MDPMQARPPLAAEPPPATAVAALAQGWRLWGRAPLPVFVVAWLPLAANIVFSIVPGVGGLLSTVASGVFSVVTWLCLDAVARGGDPAPGAAMLAAMKRPAVLVSMAMVSVLLAVATAMVVAPALGTSIAQVVLAGMPADVKDRPDVLVGALVIAPAAWLLQWMPARMLFAGRGAAEAMLDCIGALARRPALMFGFALLSVTMGVLGLLTVVGIGLVLPWLTAASYAVHRGIFGDGPGVAPRGDAGGDDAGQGDGGTLAA